MNKPAFVYVIYIASTPDNVWEALTDASISARFWFGYHVESSWRVGSPFALKQGDKTVTDTGVVLEADPPHRLSYTWHPEFEDLRHEPPSRVSFEIERQGDQVKLTVTHDDFEPGSQVLKSVSHGWPLVLSSLKSWLEAGKALQPSWSGDHAKPAATAGAAR